MRTPRRLASPARRPLRSILRRRPSNRSTPIKFRSGCSAAYCTRNEPSPLPSSTSRGWSRGKILPGSNRSTMVASERSRVLGTGLGSVFNEAQLKIANASGRFVSGNAQGFGLINGAGANRNLAIHDRDVNYFFVVEPSLDFFRRDAQTHFVPMVLVQKHRAGGFIFRSVVVVQTGKAHHAAAPAADDQTAK